MHNHVFLTCYCCLALSAAPVFKLFSKYVPESKAAKHDRLKKVAEAKAEGKEADSGAPPAVVKFGLNHVTYLIEQKKAKLVLIANDVDPIEVR